MSAIDASCYPMPPEKESGAGEMNRFKPPPGGGSSHAIASEIMSDIVDNVFEVIMAKSLQPSPKIEKITSNVVGDILENILSSPQSTGGSKDETVLLDDEIKRIINEMKYPPEQKNIICTQGVGDQLDVKVEVTPEKILTEPMKRNTLERKNRLTNLVRNSKQMLAKLVTTDNDNENDVRMTKSEEIHEKLIKVIDLDGNDHFVEPGSSSVTAILQIPQESGLDMVDLKATDETVFLKAEKTVADCSIGRTQNRKTMGWSKKKWNFGAKIMKYIKKNKEAKKE